MMNGCFRPRGGRDGLCKGGAGTASITAALGLRKPSGTPFSAAKYRAEKRLSIQCLQFASPCRGSPPGLLDDQRSTAGLPNGETYKHNERVGILTRRSSVVSPQKFRSPLFRREFLLAHAFCPPYLGSEGRLALLFFSRLPSTRVEDQVEVRERSDTLLHRGFQPGQGSGRGIA